MLRECVFRRQAVWSLDGRDPVEERTEEERLAILNTARTTVEKALQLIESGELRASKRTKLNLAAERASIYGYLAVQRGRSTDSEALWSDYLAAKAASARAVALSDDYHPIDIALWTSSDVLRGANLSDQRRAEVLADLYAALDLVDASMLTADQQIRYLERRSRVAAVIGDHDLSAKTLTELEDVAPAAATFLIAKRRAGPIDAAEPPLTRRRAGSPARRQTFFQSRRRGCRRRPPLSASSGSSTLGAGNRRSPTARRAWPYTRRPRPNRRPPVDGLCSQSAVGTAARTRSAIWKPVLSWLTRTCCAPSKSGGRSRAIPNTRTDRASIRGLLATDRNGTPIRFRGRVEGVKGTDDWRVRVEGLNMTIALLAREFRDEDLAHGRELRDFGIAFNYVGPIADPLIRPVSRR